MKIAIVGCGHGELDKIYECVRHVEQSENISVDLVICCGDFQAIRNYDDLNCMAVPQKYRELKEFYKYYSGECKAPYLTIFVGGNHEASNYLAELPYGGWVAPGIYYFGYANVLRIGSLRIAGLSGIYNGRHYNQGHFECPPYNEDTKRSAYHVRQLDAFRLKQLKPNSLDIFISHDWPRGITAFGDSGPLFRAKPDFEGEAARGELGNPATEDLLHLLKPKYWFAAHMHVKFAALVDHGDGSQTRFLALDKCLPRGQFIQIMDIGDSTGLALSDFQYDPEWLAVLKSTNHLCSTSNRMQYVPGPAPGSNIRYEFTPTEEELKEMEAKFDNNLEVPNNFRRTAPPLRIADASLARDSRQKFYINPQTTEFCSKLGITNPNELLAKLRPQAVEEAYYLQHQGAVEGDSNLEANEGDVEDPDEIPLDDEETIREPPVEIAAQKRQLEEGAAGEAPKEEDSKPKEEDKPAASETLKKFKRRNADLYSGTDVAE